MNEKMSKCRKMKGKRGREAAQTEGIAEMDDYCCLSEFKSQSQSEQSDWLNAELISIPTPVCTNLPSFFVIFLCTQQSAIKSKSDRLVLRADLWKAHTANRSAQSGKIEIKEQICLNKFCLTKNRGGTYVI